MSERKDPLLGAVIADRYLIEKRVGMGGMGLDLSPIIVVFGAQLLLFPLLGCGFF